MMLELILTRFDEVDRRVVDTTAQAIREDENLWKVFKNVRSMTFLGDLAPILGLGVIEITPVNAAKTGLLGDVAGAVARPSQGRKSGSWLKSSMITGRPVRMTRADGPCPPGRPSSQLNCTPRR